MSDSPVKILILRLSSIGDILLSSSFIRQTRFRWPNAKIDFVIKKQFVDLIRYNPHIDTIIRVDSTSGIRGLLKLRNQLKDKRYDYVFDLHNNFRTKILSAGIMKTKRSTICKNKLRRFILVFTKKNFYKKILQIPLRYLKVAEKWGVTDDYQGLEIYWKNPHEEKINRILSRNKISEPYIVVAAGAGFYTKRWPLPYFKELVRRIAARQKQNIILLGNQTEAAYMRDLEVHPCIVNLAGRVSLLEAAIIINRAGLVVSNDSGLMHLATAVKTPVIALFGSTVKEFGFYPFRSRHIVLENNSVPCRPCSHIGRDQCPKEHFRCMRDIKPEDVFNHVEQFIK